MWQSVQFKKTFNICFRSIIAGFSLNIAHECETDIGPTFLKGKSNKKIDQFLNWYKLHCKQWKRSIWLSLWQALSCVVHVYYWVTTGANGKVERERERVCVWESERTREGQIVHALRDGECVSARSCSNLPICLWMRFHLIHLQFIFSCCRQHDTLARRHWAKKEKIKFSTCHIQRVSAKKKSKVDSLRISLPLTIFKHILWNCGNNFPKAKEFRFCVAVVLKIRENARRFPTSDPLSVWHGWTFAEHRTNLHENHEANSSRARLHGGVYGWF